MRMYVLTYLRTIYICTLHTLVRRILFSTIGAVAMVISLLHIYIYIYNIIYILCTLKSSINMVLRM